MTKIKKITIYGERCSGTTYLQKLLENNFNDFELTWEYGWKHFFGHNDLSNSDDTLFICIVRNPFDWLNSFYQNPHHLIDVNLHSINNFLSKEIASYEYNSKSFNNPNGFQGKEIMKDRHIYTKKRYKNIFELRHTKLKFMIETLPKIVNHYIFIKYEDLINNFKKTMNKIKNKGLNVKSNISFPLNYKKYKNVETPFIFKKYNNIDKERILNDPKFNKYYEKLLGYI